MSENSGSRNIVAPVLNINGTPAEHLIEGYCDVTHRLRNTIEAMQKNAPHGRDYQTADPGRYDAARKLHTAMVRMVQSTLEFYEALALDVQRQETERERIRNASKGGS